MGCLVVNDAGFLRNTLFQHSCNHELRVVLLLYLSQKYAEICVGTWSPTPLRQGTEKFLWYWKFWKKKKESDFKTVRMSAVLLDVTKAFLGYADLSICGDSNVSQVCHCTQCTSGNKGPLCSREMLLLLYNLHVAYRSSSSSHKMNLELLQVANTFHHVHSHFIWNSLGYPTIRNLCKYFINLQGFCFCFCLQGGIQY